MHAQKRTLVTIAALALLGASAMPVDAAVAAPSRSHCVGPHHGCYRTVQAAINAAHDGDSIVISAGVFAGGITIDKSVRLGRVS